MTAAGSTSAHAGPGVDCKAVNRGALNVELAATASDIRSIALRSGETLTFTFHAEPGPFGTLTLVEGASSPRLLLVGPSGTSVSFAAARTGAFRFQFARDGAHAASFTASCTPGRDAGRGKTPVVSRDSWQLGDPSLASDLRQVADPQGLSVEGGLPLPLHANNLSPAADAAVASPKPAGGPEMKLHWLSERYAPAGPEGPQVDGNASGVEIGINYKLQTAMRIGALAQFDPASDIPFGGRPSLSNHAWLAGPVTTVQFAPGLVLDARAAWGAAESGMDELIGAGAAAQRRLLSARLASPHVFGAWRFTPSVNFSHLEETLHASGATSAEGQSQPEASESRVAGSGRIDVAPELAYRIDMASATFIEPRAVLGSFWAFDSLSALAPGTGVHLEPRLKAEAGVTLGVIDGPKLQALGTIEEGDGTAPDAWSGRVQFSVPLK